MALWIGRVVFDPDTSEKLRNKHGIAEAEVTEAIAHGAHDQAVWHDHEDYVERLIVTGSTYTGRELIAFLRPVDESDGTWECMTAWER